MPHLLKPIFTIAICLLAGLTVQGQTVINGYATVTGISGSVLTLSNVNEMGDTFEDGEELIIMQMQDSVIGTNTGNNASFGNLGTIRSAGLFERVTIASHTESGGLPTTITVSGSLANHYKIGVNTQVKIINYPELGSPDYTTTSDLTALAWDGNIGGVLAFSVAGTLTIAHNMNVDGLGFRGAAANGNGSLGCIGATNYRVPTGANQGDKGEGIFRYTDSSHAAGQGHLLNGGGGGGSHNGGGGGGSNFTIGGEGGPGWPNCSPSAGGIGGIDLSTYISANRVFMGGGGGAGEGNNAGAQAAANGGGIILIKADEIRTSSGGCSGIGISASGHSVTSGSPQDGNSGGGAGGSIVFEANNWNVPTSCSLNVEASGGNGGNVAHGNIHGGGGGGGMGTIIYANTVPGNNVTATTNWGVGGANCYTCGLANPGGGTTNSDGVVTTPGGPLPVELLSFVAVLEGDIVSLMWLTASEINNDFFEVEKSVDGQNWEPVALVPGAGNSNKVLQYNAIDAAPYQGLTYYRLIQTDYDGTQSISPTRVINLEEEANIPLLVYPNPTTDYVLVESSAAELKQLRVFNAMGQEMTLMISPTPLSVNRMTVSLQNLTPGVYTFTTPTYQRKLIKQ
ncbi:MAG: T9SS type A sorting domain-containing protein [Salibacteraceae bacterium]